MENLLNFKNIDKENLEKIIENILSINLKTLNQIDSITLLQFNESSTRTRLSFNVAAQLLGLKILENQDAISARVKGEILDHEIDTYKSLGVETLVVRTKENNIVDYENFEDFSVISGGFGNSSHPTQALIDISTLIKFDKLSYEIPITYVGDLKHSRVFSSGRELLTKLGYKVGILTNKDLLPDNLDNLHIFNSWEEVIKYSGSVELLRIQKERLKNSTNLSLFNIGLSDKEEEVEWDDALEQKLACNLIEDEEGGEADPVSEPLLVVARNR